MTDYFVTDELKSYLIAQGIGVDPNTPSLTLPSIWTMPFDGAPEPRLDKATGDVAENATVSLREMNFSALGSPADLEEAFVDVIVRSRTAVPGKTLHRRIRELIIDTNDSAGMRKMWTMHNLLVEYSGTWRPEQPLAADKVSTTRIASYRFGCRRKSLRGLPYTP